QEALLYPNNARSLHKENHYLQVSLQVEGHNRFGVGAKVTMQNGQQMFYQELSPTRGFQSSSDYVLTFGVGKVDTVQTGRVEWPGRRGSSLQNATPNQ